MGIRRRRHTSMPSMDQIEAERKRTEYKTRYKQTLGSTISALLVIAAVAVLISTLFLPVVQVVGNSMEPTLHDGDIYVLVKSNSYKRGDICCISWQNKKLLKSEDIWDDMTGLYNLRGFIDELDSFRKAVSKDGHIVALVGENGVGKTTLFKCLLGFLKINCGKIKIDGKEISNWGEIILAKELAAQHSADVQLLRGTKIINVALTPAERWGLIADGSKTELRKKGFVDGLYWGARETYNQSKTLLVVLKQIITGERSSKQLGSFITIAQVSGQALSIGFWAFLSIIALLSVNLGVVNLLPLPVLDGGFLLILIIEFITRKKLQGKAMEITFACGWVLIIGLMLLTMWNDIARVFGLN